MRYHLHALGSHVGEGVLVTDNQEVNTLLHMRFTIRERSTNAHITLTAYNNTRKKERVSNVNNTT